MIPYYPSEDSTGYSYEIYSQWEHLVSQYTGLSMLEVEQLNYVDYLMYRRDAFIHNCNATEKGREYLQNAYRLTLRQPCRDELRKKFGKEE